MKCLQGPCLPAAGAPLRSGAWRSLGGAQPPEGEGRRSRFRAWRVWVRRWLSLQPHLLPSQILALTPHFSCSWLLSPRTLPLEVTRETGCHSNLTGLYSARTWKAPHTPGALARTALAAGPLGQAGCQADPALQEPSAFHFHLLPFSCPFSPLLSCGNERGDPRSPRTTLGG